VKSLDIVIVNWNSGRDLYYCLQSIIANISADYLIENVIVVDNASTDGSFKAAEAVKLPIYLIKNARNLGFAAACNQGARIGSADYILFLNPDIIIFPFSINKAINFLEKDDNKNIGIVGIQLINEKNEIFRTCARFPNLYYFMIKIMGLDRLLPGLFKSNTMNEWDHKGSRRVDQVIGAFFLVRRKLFDLLGGFDERFFVYYEEVDFSYRAYKLGLYSYYLSSARAFHKGGGSSEKIKDLRLYYNLESRILYSFKHFNFLSAILILFATVTIELLTRIGWALLNNRNDNLMITLKGFGLIWKNLWKLAKKIIILK
jgi:GT2 family glycosyltransferase